MNVFRWRLGLLVAAFAAIPSMASATIITSDLNLISDSNIGSGTLGVVTLSQDDPYAVDVSVVLGDSVKFVYTGQPTNHNAFAFNLDLVDPYTVTITSPLTGIFALQGTGSSNVPYGAFTYAIRCPGCGPGASNAYPGPLNFTVSAPGGIDLANFVANAGGFYFSADVIGPAGGTGNIASNSITRIVTVPEPATVLLIGIGLLGIGLSRFKFRR